MSTQERFLVGFVILGVVTLAEAVWRFARRRPMPQYLPWVDIILMIALVLALLSNHASRPADLIAKACVMLAFVLAAVLRLILHKRSATQPKGSSAQVSS